MSDRKDRSRMSDEFRINETVDADGHRVIVYEFPASKDEPPSRRTQEGGAASFIKVTFEGDGPPDEAVAIEDADEVGGERPFVARRGLGGRDRPR